MNYHLSVIAGDSSSLFLCTHTGHVSPLTLWCHSQVSGAARRNVPAEDLQETPGKTTVRRQEAGPLVPDITDAVKSPITLENGVLDTRHSHNNRSSYFLHLG